MPNESKAKPTRATSGEPHSNSLEVSSGTKLHYQPFKGKAASNDRKNILYAEARKQSESIVKHGVSFLQVLFQTHMTIFVYQLTEQ